MKTTITADNTSNDVSGVTEPSENEAFQLFENMNRMKAWAGVHINNDNIYYQFSQIYGIKNWILLDSESSTTIFCNKNYVLNIRQVNNILDMSTNGGPIYTNKRCTIEVFNMSEWFNEESLTNIISFAEASDKYNITYNNKNSDMFNVHIKEYIIPFKRASNNLYYYQLNKNNN